jgi:amino acid efflux transporter
MGNICHRIARPFGNHCVMTTTRGIALYIGALLGPGLLVLPGLAAAEAGPASVLAWAGLLLLSGLVAVVFARFGTALRSAGGVADYVAAGLGPRAGRAAGWCFLVGIIAGAPIVCTMGAGYLTTSHPRQALIGGVMLALLIALSRRGLRASTGVQLALVAVLLLVLVLAVGGALPDSHAANFRPFAPHGWSSIGSAAAVLMLSFFGWEAVAPLTTQFSDPRRQLPRVIGTAFAVTAVTYLALAAVTVAALGPSAGTEVPMTALLTFSIGPAAHVVAAAAAVLLTLGTVNAYLAGGAALARTVNGPSPTTARWFPISLVASGIVILGLIGPGVLPIAAAVTIPVSFILVVYIGCMLSAARTMPGRTRPVAVVAAVANLLILGYAGSTALPAIVVAAVAALKSPRGRAVDELLGTAVERPALDQLEVEVAGAAEDRAGPGTPGDDGENRHLHPVDEAGGHQRPVQRQAGRRT